MVLAPADSVNTRLHVWEGILTQKLTHFESHFSVLKMKITHAFHLQILSPDNKEVPCS